jgi:predicted adenylyl cyclase CyaB
MARNVEIKARIVDFESVRFAAEKLADSEPVEIFQDDTFFCCPNGRLKLRKFSANKGELIFYRRPDDSGPKESFYIVSPVTSPDTLRQALSLAYGECGRVIKHRTLYLVGRTRIHLDKVDGLGEFLELEVVLAEDESVNAGAAVAHALLFNLNIAPDQLIDCAYVDLLQKQANKFE